MAGTVCGFLKLCVCIAILKESRDYNLTPSTVQRGFRNNDFSFPIESHVV